MTQKKIDRRFDKEGTHPGKLDSNGVLYCEYPLRTWLYKNPFSDEELPEGVSLNPRVVEINGMKFQARSDCKYQHNIYGMVDKLYRISAFTDKERKERPLDNEPNIIRNLLKTNLWALVYFVLKNPLANHPFIVEACKEIQLTEGDSLQAWARDHLKTTIISVGRRIQKVLNNPEETVAIISATRPLAVKILNTIKMVLESPFVVRSFPDILYEDPAKEARKWTEAPEGGLFVKRESMDKTPTFSAYGLIQGMPVGEHFSDLLYDDIVNQDLLAPDVMAMVKDRFDMSENLGSRKTQRTVVGTFYDHDDPLVYIMNKEDPLTGIKLYPLVKKAATVDGTLMGESVFSPEWELQRKRAGNLYIFFCQQLLDPTPRGMEKLNKDHLIRVRKGDLPENLFKFMVIDGAGDKGKRTDNRRADAWAMAVIGVEPHMDDLGYSRVYILDLLIKEMDLATAQSEAVAMYCRNGRILKLGVEKVGMSTTEIHIVSALRARRKFISIESGNLQILQPKGRTKKFRIESALALPLKNGKIHLLDTLPEQSVERLCIEMEKFPAWHDDGLDAISYVYDIVKEYRFSSEPYQRKEVDRWDEAFSKARKGNLSGWMMI